MRISPSSSTYTIIVQRCTLKSPRELLTRRGEEIISTRSVPFQQKLRETASEHDREYEVRWVEDTRYVTYTANKTSSHVIPILFLTRIDHPDSICPKLISSTIGDVAGCPRSLIPTSSVRSYILVTFVSVIVRSSSMTYIPKTVRVGTKRRQRVRFRRGGGTYRLCIIVIDPDGSKHRMLTIRSAHLPDFHSLMVKSEGSSKEGEPSFTGSIARLTSSSGTHLDTVPSEILGIWFRIPCSTLQKWVDL